MTRLFSGPSHFRRAGLKNLNGRGRERAKKTGKSESRDEKDRIKAENFMTGTTESCKIYFNGIE